MIPNHKQRDVQTSGLDEQAVFGISVNDQAHVMQILRDTLYTDKLLAVLREYSANAWDAHRMVGKDDLPIKITLPTPTEPTLSIRDFGPGLSQDEVFTVFTQYGASTKRSTDRAVGTLGIGSKSGFAYSDSFTIDSYNGGVKSTYVAVLDKSEKGVITLLSREPCGEETGLDVQVPIKPADIPLFIDKAKGLFRYFIPKPVINTEISDMAEISRQMKHGVITKSGGWIAVMGCIPYRINIDQLQSLRNNEEESVSIRRFLSKMDGLLFFKIGEVQIAANREELRYSDETKAALVARFNDLVEEYVTSALKDVQDSGLTQFERRIRLWQFESLKFAVPEVLAEFMNPSIEVDKLKEFTFLRINSYRKPLLEPMDQFDVREDLSFVIKDDSRAFEGFKLEGKPLIVKLKAKKYSEWAKMMPSFEKFLQDSKLSGVKIVKLSECSFTQPARKCGHREVNEKHKVSTFRYSLTARGGSGSADDWVIESRTPQDDDVFVILKKFKTYKPHPYGHKEVKYNFHSEYSELKERMELLDEKMPPIYGYKSTEKTPVLEEDVKGTEFLKWSAQKEHELLAKALTSPKVLAKVEVLAWEELSEEIYHDTHHTYLASETNLNVLMRELGDQHPLSSIMKSFCEAEMSKRASYSDHSVIKDLIEGSKELMKMKEKAEKAFRKRVKAVRSKYPLLETASGGLSNLLCGDSKNWIHYVKLMDKEMNTNGRTTSVHPHQRVIDSCVPGKDAHSQELPAELRIASPGPSGQGLGQHPQVLDGQQGVGGVGTG